MKNNLTADQQIVYNILTKVYMADGQSLLSARINYREKINEDIEAAVEQIRNDYEAGLL